MLPGMGGMPVPAFLLTVDVLGHRRFSLYSMRRCMIAVY
jgi:hypothetical protein